MKREKISLFLFLPPGPGCWREVSAGLSSAAGVRRLQQSTFGSDGAGTGPPRGMRPERPRGGATEESHRAQPCPAPQRHLAASSRLLLVTGRAAPIGLREKRSKKVHLYTYQYIYLEIAQLQKRFREKKEGVVDKVEEH